MKINITHYVNKIRRGKNIGVISTDIEKDPSASEQQTGVSSITDRECEGKPRDVTLHGAAL